MKVILFIYVLNPTFLGSNPLTNDVLASIEKTKEWDRVRNFLLQMGIVWISVDKYETNSFHTTKLTLKRYAQKLKKNFYKTFYDKILH